MGCFERMRTQMKSTGLYRLDGDTLVEAEMRAYAAELERLFTRAEEILKDCFIDEVESPKGEIFEDLFGLPQTKFPLDEEKTAIREYKIKLMKRRLAVKNNDFNPEAMKGQIETGGMAVSFTEDTANKKITVDVLSDEGYIERETDKEYFIKQILPVHSTVEINF